MARIIVLSLFLVASTEATAGPEGLTPEQVIDAANGNDISPWVVKDGMLYNRYHPEISPVMTAVGEARLQLMKARAARAGALATGGRRYYSQPV